MEGSGLGEIGNDNWKKMEGSGLGEIGNDNWKKMEESGLGEIGNSGGRKNPHLMGVLLVRGRDAVTPHDCVYPVEIIVR